MRKGGDLTEEQTMATVIYCSVSRDGDTIHYYNGGGEEGGKGELEALAADCLRNAPRLHSWYSHTDEMRTLGFLIDDGITYFAVAYPSSGGEGILNLLRRVRESLKKVPGKPLKDILFPPPENEKPNFSAMEKEKTTERVIHIGGENLTVVESPASLKKKKKMSLKMMTPRSPNFRQKLRWRRARIVAAVDVVLLLVLLGLWLVARKSFPVAS